LRGLLNTSKVHVLRCAAYNLGLLLRKMWGMAKPRNAAEGLAGMFLAIFALGIMVTAWVHGVTDRITVMLGALPIVGITLAGIAAVHRRQSPGSENGHSLMGC
jgi:predicted MFS family arabinose efflux permease